MTTVRQMLDMWDPVHSLTPVLTYQLKTCPNTGRWHKAVQASKLAGQLPPSKRVCSCSIEPIHQGRSKLSTGQWLTTARDLQDQPAG